MSRTRHHGDRQKQRRFGEDWRWLLATPGYWTREMMTVPQRRAVRDWERNTTKTPQSELDTLDLPPHGKKPHLYFW